MQCSAERESWERLSDEERVSKPWAEPTLPKALALPGDGTKGVPLFFDRARKAGHRKLVAVEGLLDAALLQCRGDSRVVAYVAASFSQQQVETLKRHNVERVIICPDPDGGGERGAERSVRRLSEAGITAYVAPRLPDGLDPDEFLLREGIDGWREHVADPEPGVLYLARRILKDIVPESPAIRRRDVADEVVAYARTVVDERDRTSILRLIAERTGYGYGDLKKQARPAGGGGKRNGTPRDTGGGEPAMFPYHEHDGCLVFDDPNQDQGPEILTNFTARIVAEVERHETGEVKRQFRIEAVHSDGQAGEAVVDAEEYESMGWVPSQLGGGWVIAAGRRSKEHARAAVQILSHRDGITRETAHTAPAGSTTTGAGSTSTPGSRSGLTVRARRSAWRWAGR